MGCCIYVVVVVIVVVVVVALCIVELVFPSKFCEGELYDPLRVKAILHCYVALTYPSPRRDASDIHPYRLAAWHTLGCNYKLVAEAASVALLNCRHRVGGGCVVPPQSGWWMYGAATECVVEVWCRHRVGSGCVVPPQSGWWMCGAATEWVVEVC